MAPPSVVPPAAVMILNYNGMRWLNDCLASVVRSSYRNLDVYVIDNGSSDGSVGFVKANFPQVKIIQLKVNLGFADGYNKAIAQVEAEYLILLNNDTQVLNHYWIDELVKKAEQDRLIAAISCKLVAMNDHSRLDSVGGVGIRYWLGFSDIGRNETDDGQYDNPPIAPFSACGASMLVRKSAFDRVGGFDRLFFAYMEDVDLSWRLRLLGYDMAYLPSAEVAHYLSGTGAKAYWKQYLCYRNILRAILKNCASTLRSALRDYLLYLTMLALISLYSDLKQTAVIGQAILWNLYHFRDTYSRRLQIQRSRVIDDSIIFARMYPPYFLMYPSYIRGRQTLSFLYRVMRTIQNRLFYIEAKNLKRSSPTHDSLNG